MTRLLAALAVLLAFASQAHARPLYLTTFIKKYPKVAAAARAAKCAVCHPVKNKKMRNAYGMALGRHIGMNQKVPGLIDKAFAATEKVEVVNGQTYGDILAAGQLPNVAPPAPAPAAAPAAKKEEKWVQLFNGKNLDGWIPKIRGYDVGENYGNTFRVEDGLLKVRYDPEAYETYDFRFGHLFYEKPFSKYRLRVEYRFVGDQCPGGEGWAFRNSGIMVHGEMPDQMTKDQKFPSSIEVQLLGGKGTGNRPTSNLCTPGTHVVMNGKLFKPHCTNSKSKTYHGDQWVTAELEVHGSEVIKHVIDGEVVLEYTQPQLDDSEHSKMLAEKRGGKLLDSGSISLQSESHPCDFRKVEILVLEE